MIKKYAKLSKTSVGKIIFLNACGALTTEAYKCTAPPINIQNMLIVHTFQKSNHNMPEMFMKSNEDMSVCPMYCTEYTYTLHDFSPDFTLAVS